MTSAFKKKKEPTNISHHRAVAIPDYNQSFHKDICNIIWSDNIGKLEILEFNSSKKMTIDNACNFNNRIKRKPLLVKKTYKKMAE